MSDKKGGRNIDDLLNAIEKGVDLVRENSEVIESVVSGGAGDSVNGRLSHLEPLKQATKTEDRYEVTIQVEETGPLDVNLSEKDGHVVIGVGGSKYRVDVPDDTDIYRADAMLNNGVLTVSMPRSSDEDPDVEVSVKDIDGKIDDDEKEEE